MNYTTDRREGGMEIIKKYQLKDERGFTLVEVLVTTALLSVVALLAMSLLMTIMGQNNKIQDKMALITDSNQLVLTMRHDYYAGEDTGTLDIPEADIVIESLTINGTDIPGTASGIDNIPFDAPLTLDIETASPSGSYNMHIQTTWRPMDDERTIQINE